MLSSLDDKWKKAVDSNKVFGALLADLSKEFDCICHDLLVAKLHAHGLSLPALEPKIGSSYSTWENIISRVPQCSILRLILFSIFFMRLIFGT